MSKTITNESNKQTLTFHNLESKGTSAASGDFAAQSKKVQADIDALEGTRNKLASLQSTSGNLTAQQAQEASQTVAQLKDQAATFRTDQAALLNLVSDGTEANQAVNASYQQGAQRINEALGAAGSLQNKGLANALGTDAFNKVKSDAGSAVDSLNRAGKESSFTNYAGQFNAGTAANPFAAASNSSTAAGGTGGTSPSGGTGGTSPSGGTGGASPSGGTAGTSPSGGTAGTSPSGGTGGTSPSGGTAGTSPSGGVGGAPFGHGSSYLPKTGDPAPTPKEIEAAIGSKDSAKLTNKISLAYAGTGDKLIATPSKANITNSVNKALSEGVGGGSLTSDADKNRIINDLTDLYSRKAQAGPSSQSSGTANPSTAAASGSSPGGSANQTTTPKLGDKAPTAQAVERAVGPQYSGALTNQVSSKFAGVGDKLTQLPTKDSITSAVNDALTRRVGGLNSVPEAERNRIINSLTELYTQTAKGG